MTITFSRPLSRADHDGNSHFAPEVLLFVLQHMLVHLLLFYHCFADMYDDVAEKLIERWQLLRIISATFGTYQEITHPQIKAHSYFFK